MEEDIPCLVAGNLEMVEEEGIPCLVADSQMMVEVADSLWRVDYSLEVEKEAGNPWRVVSTPHCCRLPAKGSQQGGIPLQMAA